MASEFKGQNMTGLSVDMCRMHTDLETSLLRNGVCGVRKHSCSQLRSA